MFGVLLCISKTPGKYHVLVTIIMSITAKIIIKNRFKKRFKGKKRTTPEMSPLMCYRQPCEASARGFSVQLTGPSLGEYEVITEEPN